MIDSQLDQIGDLLLDIERLRNAKSRTLMRAKNTAKNPDKIKDADDTHLCKQRIAQLTAEKKTLTTMFLYLCNVKGRLEQMRLTVQSAHELESTLELIKYVSGLVQDGEITESQLSSMMEIMNDSQVAMFPQEEPEEQTMEERLPEAPTGAIRIKEQVQYDSL